MAYKTYQELEEEREKDRPRYFENTDAPGVFPKAKTFFDTGDAPKSFFDTGDVPKTLPKAKPLGDTDD